MKRNAGNALWFILIAIFLLAALTMLITRTGQQTEETGDQERASTKASELILYFSGLQTAVQKLLTNGCSENQLNFATDVYKDPGGGIENLAAYFNGPADGSCDIYGNAGGVRARMFGPNNFGTPTFTAQNYVSQGTLPVWAVSAVIPGLGTDAPEMVAELPHIDMKICNEINKRVGIGLYEGSGGSYVLDPVNGNAPPPMNGTTGYYRFGVINADDPHGAPLDPLNDDLRGKKMFCAANTSASSSAPDWSTLFTVLIVR